MIINIQMVDPSPKYTEAQLEFAKKFQQWLEINYKEYDILNVMFSSLPFSQSKEKVSVDPYTELVFREN